MPRKHPTAACPAKSVECGQKSEKQPSEPVLTSPSANTDTETDLAIELANQFANEPDNTFAEVVPSGDKLGGIRDDDDAVLWPGSPAKKRARNVRRV